jgi:hypothetical protein
MPIELRANPDFCLLPCFRPLYIGPRRLSDILIKFAHASNVSIKWLARGQGEMRLPGSYPRNVRRCSHPRTARHACGVHMEQIRTFLPLSRWWLEHRLGIREPKELILLEADQDLPPEIRKSDLLLVDRSAG